jgi:hypothetical protein
VELDSFLTSALEGGECSAPCCGCCTPRNEPLYPLNRRVGGPLSQSQCFGEEKDLLLLPRFELPVVWPIALLLFQLRYPAIDSIQYRI